MVPVVMLGTGLETRGGIAAVVQAYRDAGLFERWPIEYLATHRDGTQLQKMAAATGAFLRFLVLLVRLPRAVLHVHGASHASFWRKAVFMSLAHAAGWPVVFHLHGGGFERFYQQECGPRRQRVVRHFLDRAAAIVVVSERWMGWMRRATANPRIVCIPNPVASPPSVTLARKGALVAFVGRCEPAKGVFDLVDTVAELSTTIPEVRLECAGDGNLEGIERRAAELGIRGHVHLPGWLDAQRRDALLARASVFVLPSYAEALPMSLLEAMAAGVPVVASAVGGIPDVIAHGVNGLLVPPGNPDALRNAVRRLITDRAFAERLAGNARDTIAARFTPERSIGRLEQLYGGLGVTGGAARATAASARLQENS